MDIAAMRTHINSALATELLAGQNGAIRDAFNVLDNTAPKVWRDLPVDEFFDAIAPASFTVDELARIQLWTAGRDTVFTSRPNVRTWLETTLADQPGPLATFLAVVEVFPTVAQAVGATANGEIVTAAHVREAVKGMAGSFVSIRGVHPDARQVGSSAEVAIRTALGAPTPVVGETRINKETVPIQYGGQTIQPGETFTTAIHPKNPYPAHLGVTRTVTR